MAWQLYLAPQHVRLLEAVLESNALIHKKLDRIMALQDDINEKEQAILDAFGGYATELEGEIATLKTQIANGQTADLSGLDAITAKIKAATVTDAPQS